MTEPPPHPEESPREPLPERVVESVREEVRELHDRIEEAVEHALPVRARWSAGKIATVILLSLFGLVLLLGGGAVLYVWRHSEWAAGRLTTLINRSLAERSDLVLEVRDLRGNPFRRVQVIGPRVRFRGDSGPPLLEAPSMTVSYTPWDLWFGRRRSITVTLEQPVVRLTRRPDGSLRIPEWRSGPKVQRPVRELEVLLSLRDGTVVMPEPDRGVSGWNFDARAVTGQATQVRLDRMSWEKGPFETKLAELSGEITAADSVTFFVRRLVTGDLQLGGRGGWKAGERRKEFTVDLGRVRWAWLARVLDEDFLDVSGEGSGRLALAVDDGWSGRFDIGASWDDIPVAAEGAFRHARGRLLVSPVSLDSRAGNLDGRVAYDGRDLEVRGQVEHANPVYWGFLGLDDWPEGDLNGDLLYASRKRAGARILATLGGSTIAGWRADSAHVRVELPEAARDSFAVVFLRRGGRADLAGTIVPGGWVGRWAAERFPLDEWPDGRRSGLVGLLARGGGTVEGREGGLYVAGDLEGPSAEWLGLETAGWTIRGMNGRLLPTPDLEVPTVLRDFMFLGLHFDSAAAPLRVGDGRVDFANVDAVAGDTLLAVAGHAHYGTGTWQVVLDRASARSDQFRWTAEPPVRISGDPKGVVFERLVARDSLSRLEVTGRWGVPGGFYDWTARGENLDLARLGLPLELELGGTASGVLRVEGRHDDPGWTFAGAASRPGLYGHAADSLTLSLWGRHHRLDVRDMAFHLDGGALRARLSFAGMPEADPDSLTATAVQRWISGAARWEGEVRADSLPLEGLERLTPAAAGWAGRVEGTLDVGGRPDAPELDLRASARPLAWNNLAVEALEGRASYHDGLLEVPDLKVTRGSIVSVVSGRMPLRLALGRPLEVPEEPMAWRMDVENGDLGVLPLMVQQVGDATGRFDLHATVEGSARSPRMRGEAHVREGEIRLAGREEVVEGIHADFHFDEAVAVMDTLIARQGEDGRVTGSGRVELGGFQVRDYTFMLKLRDFTTVESGLYEAEFDGDLVVTRGDAPVRGQYLPHISGTVQLERAVVLFDFANQSETEQLAANTQPPVWTYGLTLLANNNLRWQPPDGDIEFSAELTLQQTEKELSIFGDLKAIRGTYNFLSNRFTVRRADLNFDDVGGVNPIINAEATTRILPVGADAAPATSGLSSGEPVMHTITVRITGRADHPVIEFASDPSDWDQATILRELTVGRFVEGSALALGDPLDNYLTRKINEQLSPLLSRTFLRDVGQWQIEREQGGLFYGRGEVVLGLAHQFNQNLLVTYRQRLPGFERGTVGRSLINDTFERDIEAEYRINRFFYITTEVRETRTTGTAPVSSSPYQTNVNLRARWEY